MDMTVGAACRVQPVVPHRVLAAGIHVEMTSDCTVSVGSLIGSCVVQTKGRLGVVSVVDTAANTVKVRFDLQFDEKDWEHAEITAAHSQLPERPYAIVSVDSVKELNQEPNGVSGPEGSLYLLSVLPAGFYVGTLENILGVERTLEQRHDRFGLPLPFIMSSITPQTVLCIKIPANVNFTPHQPFYVKENLQNLTNYTFCYTFWYVL